MNLCGYILYINIYVYICLHTYINMYSYIKNFLPRVYKVLYILYQSVGKL